jgi:L-amino acid N-acyltransferase YncA
MTFAELFPPRPSPRERLVNETLKDIEFRVASADDAPELAKLFETFFEEAHYQDRGIVYSLSKSEEWLRDVIGSGRVPHLVAVKDGRIIGSTSYSLDSTFCEEPVAVMCTTYVLASYRRSAIGRVLIALVTDLAKNDGAAAFHAPIMSEMKEQASFINLFRHGGFEPVGVIMGRRL